MEMQKAKFKIQKWENSEMRPGTLLCGVRR